MTVAPASSQIVARPIVRSADATARETADPASSFAELLGAEWDGQNLELDSAPSEPAPSQLEGQLESERYAGSYRLVSDIAESAIRFDAKPVVAGSQVDEPDTNLASSAAVAATQTPAGATPQDVRLRSETPVIADDIQSVGPGGPVGDPNADPVIASEPTAKPMLASELSATPPAPLPSGPAVESANQPLQSAPGRIAPADVPAAARPLPASIAVMPTEVIVTVHGLPLTVDERDALVVEARRLLLEQGLGDRVIRVLSDEGGTSPWR